MEIKANFHYNNLEIKSRGNTRSSKATTLKNAETSKEASKTEVLEQKRPQAAQALEQKQPQTTHWRGIASNPEVSSFIEMETFKKDFYDELSKMTQHASLSNVAINISEDAFQAMKEDPEYRETMLSLIKRDLGSYYGPGSNSLVLTIGAGIDDYRGDSWTVGYDSEFSMRSQNSFYKKTSTRNDKEKKLLEEYIEKRRKAKKLQRELYYDKIDEHKRNQQINDGRQTSRAAMAYEASAFMEMPNLT